MTDVDLFNTNRIVVDEQAYSVLEEEVVDGEHKFSVMDIETNQSAVVGVRPGENMVKMTVDGRSYVYGRHDNGNTVLVFGDFSLSRDQYGKLQYLTHGGGGEIRTFTLGNWSIDLKELFGGVYDAYTVAYSIPIDRDIEAFKWIFGGNDNWDGRLRNGPQVSVPVIPGELNATRFGAVGLDLAKKLLPES